MFLNDRSTTEFFCAPKEAQKLTRQTYHPSGNTPLFSRSVEALEDVLYEARRLTAQGKMVRTMTIIFTDGGDNGPSNAMAHDVKRIVDIMLTTGSHIVGACAVNDSQTNFWRVFTEMGIPENWIKVLDNTPRSVTESVIDLGSMASMASTGRHEFNETSQTGFYKKIKHP
jgi:hypothetical protein